MVAEIRKYNEIQNIEQLSKAIFFKRGVEYNVVRTQEFVGMDEPMLFTHRKLGDYNEPHTFYSTANKLLTTSAMCEMCDKGSMYKMIPKIKDWLEFEGYSYDQYVEFEEGENLIFDFMVNDLQDENGEDIVLLINYLDRSQYDNVTTEMPHIEARRKFCEDNDIMLIEINHINHEDWENILREYL